MINIFSGRPFVLLFMISVSGCCCNANPEFSFMNEENNKWLPYEKGQKIAFISQRNIVDTLLVDDFSRKMDKEGIECIDYFEVVEAELTSQSDESYGYKVVGKSSIIIIDFYLEGRLWFGSFSPLRKIDEPDRGSYFHASKTINGKTFTDVFQLQNDTPAANLHYDRKGILSYVIAQDTFLRVE